jgi:hypothetical protein
VLVYYALDTWNYVFVDARGLPIATIHGIPADLDAILELFAESGVPVVTLERSPMLSLWLRRLGFRTDGRRPIQGIVLKALGRLWWRLLAPLALVYHLAFGSAFTRWDESLQRHLAPAERWLGIEAPYWLDDWALFVLVPSAIYLGLLLFGAVSALINHLLAADYARRLNRKEEDR